MFDRKKYSAVLLNITVFILVVLHLEYCFVLLLVIYLVIRNKLSKSECTEYYVFNFVSMYVYYFYPLIDEMNLSSTILFCICCIMVQFVCTAINRKLYTIKKDSESMELLRKKIHEMDNLQIAQDFFIHLKGKSVCVFDFKDLLDQYRNQFEVNHFQMKWVVENCELPFTYEETISIINNLLNNALIHGQKNINFQINRFDQKLIILLKNEIKKQKLKNTKMHGHGLSVIQSIVEKYQGELLVVQEDNHFICMIIIDDSSLE